MRTHERRPTHGHPWQHVVAGGSSKATPIAKRAARDAAIARTNPPNAMFDSIAVRSLPRPVGSASIRGPTYATALAITSAMTPWTSSSLPAKW